MSGCPEKDGFIGAITVSPATFAVLFSVIFSGRLPPWFLPHQEETQNLSQTQIGTVCDNRRESDGCQ